MCALDQPLRQSQPRAQLKLAASHASGVGFVIVACQMKQAVEDQYFELRFKRVAARCGLAPRRPHADSQVAGHFLFFLALDRFMGRKRKNVSGFVFAAISPVQPPDCLIGREQHADFAAQPHCGLSLAQEAAESSR
jgi:hypothetical protein